MQGAVLSRATLKHIGRHTRQAVERRDVMQRLLLTTMAEVVFEGAIDEGLAESRA